MEELRKKVEKARADRAAGTRREVMPTIQSEEWRKYIVDKVGVDILDMYALVTVMGPKGCRVAADKFAHAILCIGPKEMCDEIGDRFQKKGFYGERYPCDLAVVRLNRFYEIPFDVGEKTEMVYEEEEMQLLWDQKAGDVDLVGGMEAALRESVDNYFVGFK